MTTRVFGQRGKNEICDGERVGRIRDERGDVEGREEGGVDNDERAGLRR